MCGTWSGSSVHATNNQCTDVCSFLVFTQLLQCNLQRLGSQLSVNNSVIMSLSIMATLPPAANYNDLYQWSVDSYSEFWAEVWRFCGVLTSKPYEEVSPMSSRTTSFRLMWLLEPVFWHLDEAGILFGLLVLCPSETWSSQILFPYPVPPASLLIEDHKFDFIYSFR